MWSDIRHSDLYGFRLCDKEIVVQIKFLETEDPQHMLREEIAFPEGKQQPAGGDLSVAPGGVHGLGEATTPSVATIRQREMIASVSPFG